MKDETYDQLVLQKLNSIDYRSRALMWIGQDESLLQEVEPLFLHGFNYMDDGSYVKYGKDLRWRASKYDAAWLFFSDTQVYLYKFTFDMIDDSYKETTVEYFYKDITNFTTSDATESRVVAKQGCRSRPVRILRQFKSFTLVVPGDTFTVSVAGSPNADESIAAVKQKLREKKLI